MGNRVVIAYVFDDPEDMKVLQLAAAVSRQLFEEHKKPIPPEIKLPLLKKIENLKVHLAVGGAADTIAFFVETGELPGEAPEESNWEKHARRELELVGEDPDMIECMCKTLRGWASFGHSGGSHYAAVGTLFKLLDFENLTPLTNDPSEWNHIAEDMDGTPGGIWQSQRNAKAFSNDGGKTYYLIPDEHRVIHTSVEKTQ